MNFRKQMKSLACLGVALLFFEYI